MPSSDDSSEISPSLAEFTAQSIPAATTVTTSQLTPTAPAAIAASDRTDRPVFPVTILGPTNSSNQAPPNRHDDDDVHTTRQHNNVTLRSSDANANSHQQTRPASDAERVNLYGGEGLYRRRHHPVQCRCYGVSVDGLSWRLTDRKSTRLNSSHLRASRMPSSA